MNQNSTVSPANDEFYQVRLAISGSTLLDGTPMPWNALDVGLDMEEPGYAVEKHFETL